MDAPPEFTDAAGRWVRTGEARGYDAQPETAARADTSEAPELDVADMTIEKIAERFRPVMDFQGYEYVLDDASTRELAEKMQRQARTVSEMSMPATGPNGEVFDESAADTAARDPHVVIGTDSRTPISSYAATEPYIYNAVMYRGLDSDIYPEGTGLKLLNNYTMVTAAHVVHNGNGWFPVNDIEFAAGSTGARGRIPGWCYGTTVPGCWRGERAETCDVAIIRLRVGSSADPCDKQKYGVGAFGYWATSSWYGTLSSWVSIWGYPNHHSNGHPGGSWDYPTMFYAHSYQGSYFGGLIFHYTDTSAGQSGAAITHPSHSTAVGIHKGAPSDTSSYNWGVLFTPSLISWLDSLKGY